MKLGQIVAERRSMRNVSFSEPMAGDHSADATVTKAAEVMREQNIGDVLW